MTTNYGPYDAKLLKHDKLRQLAAFYTADKFEGVDLKVSCGRDIGHGFATIRQLVSGLLHKGQLVTRSSNHSVSHA